MIAIDHFTLNSHEEQTTYTMKVTLPRSTMSDQDILRFVTRIKIPNFRGVRMRDELAGTSPRCNECGVLNLETHSQQGTHWTCWFKEGKDRYYFDSYGEPPPLEIIKYLKTGNELKNDKPVIKRSAVTVQQDESSECGALCLYVLKKLSEGFLFPVILEGLLKRYDGPPAAACRRRLVIQL